MNITRETTPATERCVIDLEQDFPSRTSALDFIYEQNVFQSSAILSELYNANAPDIWIKFTVNSTHALLGISLH